jgi:hypothetical protein
MLVPRSLIPHIGSKTSRAPLSPFASLMDGCPVVASAVAFYKVQPKEAGNGVPVLP